MNRKTKLISVSLMPEMLRDLNKIAKEENRTRSELVREAFRQYVAQKELAEIKRYGQKKAKGMGIKNENDVARLIEKI